MSSRRDLAMKRFAFGENWKRFLSLIDDDRIGLAEQGLIQLLGEQGLHGKRLIDIGSGSGLSSLAARNLGASVYSFDYDKESVACTDELKRLYRPNDDEWVVDQGSVLDKTYLSTLGEFDVVYSWGVLHHTGDMWAALENVMSLVGYGGDLVIAIYNNQGLLSKYWLMVKRLYNYGPLTKIAVIGSYAPYFGLRRLFRSLLFPGIKDGRGMDFWRDMVDWLGGYPFEVSSRDKLIAFYQMHGFELVKLNSVGKKLGCNEFVFRRVRMYEM